MKMYTYKLALTLAYQTSSTIISSSSLPINGLLRGIVVTAPDLDSTHTLTVDILDSDGYSIFSKASIAENTTTSIYIDANNYPLMRPLADDITVKITTSGAQTANRAFTVKVIYEQ